MSARLPAVLRTALVAVAAAAALVSLPRDARAVPEFPKHIAETLSLSYDPPCSICHEHYNTGIGSVRTPFGFAVRYHGIDPEDETSIGPVLQAMAKEKVDSDGDGVSDTDELAADTDPNTPGAIPLEGRQELEHGCGARISTKSPEASAFVLGLGLGALGWAVRRRRR